MLAQRRRRWVNNRQALGLRLGFDHLHDEKRWTEMNGTHKLTERDINTERTETNQHACPHFCVQRGDI